ncbi:MULTISPECIES: hypothetical protein [unclassified Bradyrhizobium]|uniref:hypothetical protein n=1 Tax=unclassified Bradyrhizobium TaxID=2631580 RepID=UPI00247863C4|nr:MULTISPECIES: hypothetical protein [unclassified Bradyrhizobium]WGS18635.1 hypothetical protein MTX22_29360 [Bradyrhizobium sp. ISRA463]WGS25458.1 hypothetical protein MTX19_26940 [Bradyrhizobium sp. ISRA464]
MAKSPYSADSVSLPPSSLVIQARSNATNASCAASNLAVAAADEASAVTPFFIG